MAALTHLALQSHADAHGRLALIDGVAESPVQLVAVGNTGVAKFIAAPLGIGSHSVSAAYGGSATLSPSDGVLPTQVVNPANSSTTLSSSSNPSAFGQSVTFFATVASDSVRAQLRSTRHGGDVHDFDGPAEPPVALFNQGEGNESQAFFTTSRMPAVGAHFNLGGPWR